MYSQYSASRPDHVDMDLTLHIWRCLCYEETYTYSWKVDMEKSKGKEGIASFGLRGNDMHETFKN